MEFFAQSEWMVWVLLPVIFTGVLVLWIVLGWFLYTHFKDIEKKFVREKNRSDYLSQSEVVISDLEAKKVQLQDSVEELKQNLLELRKSYAEEALNNEDLKKLKDQLLSIESSYAERLEILEQQIASKQAELKKLDEKQEQFEKAQAALIEFERKEQEIAEFKKQIDDLRNQITALENDKSRILTNSEVALKLNEVFDAKNLGLDAQRLRKEKEDLIGEINKLKRESENISRSNAQQNVKNAVGKYLKDALEKENLQQTNQSLQREHDRLQAVNNALKQQKNELNNQVKQLEQQGSEQTAKKALSDFIQNSLNNEALQQQNARLKQEIEQRTKDLSGQGGENKNAFDDLYQAPDFLINKFDREAPGDELGVLEAFKEQLAAENIFFNDRVIKAFHTTLKIQDISPFSVLAGLSGTGKTLLPTKYAQFMGMNNLVVSVSPRWDSPQDLLGFYNYLGGKYQATDLSKALCVYDQAYRIQRGWSVTNADSLSSQYSRRKPMFLVLIDEMNLARTEYYFSEFLSKLELKRTIRKDATPAELIKAEITLDVQNAKRLWVPENVLFVGTMNEDESTQTLSDKVLDRANVLRFGSPDFKKITEQASDWGRSERRHNPCFVSLDTWRSWKKEPDQDLKELSNRWLGQLDEYMKNLGRPFGLRVFLAMRSYLANYPCPADWDINEREDHLKQAMADQIEHKLLPKLRGVDVTTNKAAEVSNIGNFIRKTLDDDELAKSIDDSLEKSRTETGIFTWSGLTRGDD